MIEMGQERTFGARAQMSALPLTADMAQRSHDIRFLPPRRDS
jgi:hypothetical protein